MVETIRYARKPFEIDAVQVTADNMYDVAKWVGGEVRTDGDKAKFIKVRVHMPKNDRQTKAYAGDWVLYAGTGFKVYTEKAFKNSFDKVSDQKTVHNTPAEAVVAVVEQPKKEKKSA